MPTIPTNNINADSTDPKVVYGTAGDDNLYFTLRNYDTTHAINTGAGNDTVFLYGGALLST